jgi:hypothetical protein
MNSYLIKKDKNFNTWGEVKLILSRGMAWGDIGL